MLSTETKIERNGDLKNNEEERHTIVWETGGDMLLDFEHPDGIGNRGTQIELVLYDEANNVVVRQIVRGHEQIKTTVASKGTYYLSVRDIDSSMTDPGAYSFTSTLINTPMTTYDGAANNTTGSAQYTPLPYVIRGGIESYQTDVFWTEAGTGGMFELRFKHPNSTGWDPVRLELTDERGNRIVSDSLATNDTLQTTLPAAGKYFLTVRSSSISTGIYEVTPVFSTYQGVIYDAPVNDRPSDAQSLPLGRTAIGTLPSLDKDYYKFDASSGGQLSVNFLHPDGPGSQGARLSIAVSDSMGRVVMRKDIYGNDLFTAELADGGTYYLQVADVQSNEQPGYYTVMAGLASHGGSTIVLKSAGTFDGSAGNDVVHGSTGKDVMNLAAKAADYQIVVSPGGVTVFDTAGRYGRDTLFNVERLKFDDKMVAIDVNGVAGQAFRLYEATFNRASDEAGLGFWIHHLDNGLPLHEAAQQFITSAEFFDKYGPSMSNVVFVTKLYENILDREPDAAGIDYWVGLLEQGTADRADVLIGMAISDENVAKLVGATMDGIEYLAWVS